jgi:hypothetical protein
MPLISTPNLPDTDGFYASLLATHKGLSEGESHRLNARLVLILANHIGDPATLQSALELARKADDPAP